MTIHRRTLAPAGLALLLATGGAQAQEFTLKYAHVGPATEISDDQIPGEFLKFFLEGRSQGRIKVEIYPASQLGTFRDLIEQVQLNTLELTHTTVGGMASFFPELQVTDIPYTLRDDLVAEKVGRGPFMDKVREAVLERTRNVRLVAVGNTGRWRSFFTANTPIHTAADLAGIKMRTIDSPLQIEFIKNLGGNPTPVAWGEATPRSPPEWSRAPRSPRPTSSPTTCTRCSSTSCSTSTRTSTASTG